MEKITAILLCTVHALYPSSRDYNGSPINKNGVTLTATTPSAILNSYLQPANQDGRLDATFGSGGKVTTDIAGIEDTIYGLALQPDGKIVAAGQSYNGANYDFALARYNTNGSLDTSFGTGGIVTTIVGNDNDSALSVVLQPDGKIIAAGQNYNGANYDFALVRYNTNGSLDTSFGTGGIVITPIGTDDDYAHAVTLQPDGKIIAAGLTTTTGNNDFALVRYNTDGSLDTSFGTGGKVTTAIGTGNDSANGITLQSDGKIVAAGIATTSGNSDFAVVRYNTNGSLDTSFGTGGKVTTAIGTNNDSANSIALQSDGKIVAAGYATTGGNSDFAVVRYNTNGSLDTSFGTGGKVTTAIGTGNDSADAVSLQSDGKIIAAGYATTGGNRDFALVRYNNNGSLDTSFGPNSTGKVTTAIGADDDVAYAMALQTDGKIIAAGYATTGNSSFALTRYINPYNSLADFAANNNGGAGLL